MFIVSFMWVFPLYIVLAELRCLTVVYPGAAFASLIDPGLSYSALSELKVKDTRRELG